MQQERKRRIREGRKGPREDVALVVLNCEGR
jgi:hypothetical protein